MPKSAGAKYTMPEPTPQDLARAVSGITDRVAELEASIPRLPHYLRPAFVSDLPPAKGSILVWDGTSLKWIRVLVGSNGQVLTADSTASPGVAWAANAFPSIIVKEAGVEVGTTSAPPTIIIKEGGTEVGRTP